jgi:hypothetical protein
MKIGIIYCAYNCFSYVKDSLRPFIQARQNGLISEISSVSIPFAEYSDLNQTKDETTDFLISLSEENSIDKVFTEPSHIKEHKARDLCLQYLKKVDCDVVWMVDGDEFYTEQDIKNIITFVNQNKNYCWYSINFKNYIFDGKQWTDGFCPPRIFRSTFGKSKINSFFWDNDIVYEYNNNALSYKNIVNLEIPRSVCHVKHLTWLHENGKLKYEYQMKHFGACSYKWNYQKNELEFDEDFFIRNNIAKPKINQE